MRQDATTDEDGDAVMEFKPNNEFVLGVGKEDYVSYGSEVANVNVHEAIGGPLVSVSPNFWASLPPKVVVFGFGVSAHKPRGFKFETATARQETAGHNAGETYWWNSSVKGRVCGANPYQTPWTGTVTYQGWDGLYRGYNNEPVIREGSDPIALTLSQLSGAGSLSISGSEHAIGWIQLIPSLPPTVKYTASWFGWPSATIEAPLEEDESCPPPHERPLPSLLGATRHPNERE